MTNTELHALLDAAGLPSFLWEMADDTYEPCSLEFALANWNAWLDSRPAELLMRTPDQKTVPRWNAEAGDCDNLALGTMAWADCGNAWAAVKRNTSRGGLAYGTLFYIAAVRPDNYGVVGPHAINWFVDYDNNVRFFEPGIGAEVTLTIPERSSAWFGIAA